MIQSQTKKEKASSRDEIPGPVGSVRQTSGVKALPILSARRGVFPFLRVHIISILALVSRLGFR